MKESVSDPDSQQFDYIFVETGRVTENPIRIANSITNFLKTKDSQKIDETKAKLIAITEYSQPHINPVFSSQISKPFDIVEIERILK